MGFAPSEKIAIMKRVSALESELSELRLTMTKLEIMAQNATKKSAKKPKKKSDSTHSKY